MTRRPTKPRKVPISTLIDVVFLLITFFIGAYARIILR